MSYKLEPASDGSLTIPAETMNELQEQRTLVLERNNGHYVLKNTKPAGTPKLTPEEWLASLDQLIERASAEITTEKSLADILSEMRR